MRIFKDVFTGDELFSDSYPMKEVDDIVYEVEGKFVVEKEGDYGISANVDEDAAEGAAGEGTDRSEKKVINIVSAHRLQETGFDKKSYMAYIKTYMARVKKHLEEHNPSRVQPFMAAAQNFVKKVIGKFDDYQFFTGMSMDIDSIIVLVAYKEDGLTPLFYVFKDGVIDEKV